eukprot:scaffold103718_cov56-Phaeocystis_antarctica.AAC.3
MPGVPPLSKARLKHVSSRPFRTGVDTGVLLECKPQPQGSARLGFEPCVAYATGGGAAAATGAKSARAPERESAMAC